jgi:hypothetical protein
MEIEREQMVFTTHEPEGIIFKVHECEQTIFTVHKQDQSILFQDLMRNDWENILHDS